MEKKRGQRVGARSPCHIGGSFAGSDDANSAASSRPRALTLARVSLSGENINYEQAIKPPRIEISANAFLRSVEQPHVHTPEDEWPSSERRVFW